MHLFMEAAIKHVKEGPGHRDWRFREHESCWRKRRSHYEKVLTYRIHNWPGSLVPIGIAEDVYKLSQGRPDQIRPATKQSIRIRAYEIDLHKEPDRIRSTSVGDVVTLTMLDKQEGDRPVFGPTVFQVDRFGFSRIDDPDEACRHHDGQDCTAQSDSKYAGHECQHCGERIMDDEHGTGSPIGSMHKSCAQEHYTLHPEQW